MEILEAVREMIRHLGYRQQVGVMAFVWTLLDDKQRSLVYEFVAGLVLPKD